MDAAIFCERQRGGLCRMHVINNYLGGPIYNEESFKCLSNEYNDLPSNQYWKLNSNDQDTVFSNQEPLFAYILRTRHQLHGYMCCPTYPNSLYKQYALGTLSIIQILNQSRDNKAFVFDQGHIWVVMVSGVNLIKIDSIGGVQSTTIDDLKTLYMYYVISDPSKECVKIRDRLRYLCGYTRPVVVDRLQHGYMEIIEPLIGHFYKFCEQSKCKIKRYNDFIYEFDRSPTNLDLVPDLLFLDIYLY